MIPLRLSTVRVEEFEVYIREVTGAAYVSINLPKCKVKVVDDCPSYQFTEKSADLNQSQGDICLVLSSQIAAVGKQISWESSPLLPGSIWMSSGKTTVEADGTAAIRIKMPEMPQEMAGESFTVNIDLPENKGMIAIGENANTKCAIKPGYRNIFTTLIISLFSTKIKNCQSQQSCFFNITV